MIYLLYKIAKNNMYYCYSGSNHPFSNWYNSPYYCFDDGSNYKSNLKFSNVEQGFMFSKANLFSLKYVYTLGNLKWNKNEPS